MCGSIRTTDIIVHNIKTILSVTVMACYLNQLKYNITTFQHITIYIRYMNSQFDGLRKAIN